MNTTFLENMKMLLADRYEAYLESLHMPRSRGLKINTQKITADEFERICPFKISPVPWCEGGYFIDEDVRAAKSPLYHAGLYYLQEPSAMAPVGMSGIKRGERVLDLCAAPGGKTLQISNLVGEKGVVISNDISASRLKAVIRNVEMFGAKNTIITSIDIADMGAHKGFYTSMLIDAPCSGEGMFRKDEDVQEHWSEDSNLKYSNLQKEITYHALKLLETGTHLIYSTCTFSPMENEEVIKSMLDNDLGLSLKIEDLPKHSMSEGLLQDEVEDLKHTRRLYPFEIRGEGHYLAKLACVENGERDDGERDDGERDDGERDDGDERDERTIVSQKNEHGRAQFAQKGDKKSFEKNFEESFEKDYIEESFEKDYIEESFEKDYIEIYKNGKFEKEYFNEPPVEFKEFCKDLLKEPLRGVFRQHGEKLMLEPSFIPDLRGLRVLRRGWYLGDIKKGRFEPSNHFAMGLSFEQIKHPISFSMDDIRITKYLKCETIEAQSVDGWNIVCLDRYPLGFVKAKNGVLKNKYPSSWRML